VAPPSEIPAFVGNFVSARLIKFGPAFLRIKKNPLSGIGKLRSKGILRLSIILGLLIVMGTAFLKTTYRLMLCLTFLLLMGKN
jgi:hypothetical protein